MENQSTNKHSKQNVNNATLEYIMILHSLSKKDLSEIGNYSVNHKTSKPVTTEQHLEWKLPLHET